MDGPRVGWLSVEEAAERLGVGLPQVRRLAREGQLPARRVGHTWLIDDAGVQRRRDLEPSAGRPLSPPMAWAVLKTVDAALAGDPGDGARRGASEIAIPAGDRKERYRLRRLLASAPVPNRWETWLRRRAARQRIWVHPGVIERISADRRLRVSGAPAVAAAGLGLGAGTERPSLFYVDDEHVAAVMAKYRGHADPDGPITLMLIPAEVPSHLRPQPGVPTPPAVALVDLLDSSDARARHLANELLGRAALAFKATTSP